VSDIAQALFLAGESQVTGEAINIGTQNPQSVNQLVELLGGEVEFIPKRPGEPDRTHADILKAKSLLSWVPKTSFEEGVMKVLEQINMWKDAPIWDKEDIVKATDTWFRYLGKNETN
jgi:UDP-glucose 4-epimerase